MTYQVFHYDSQEAFSCFSHSERYRFQFFVTCNEEYNHYWNIKLDVFPTQDAFYNYLFEILWYLQMFPAKSIWAHNTPFFGVRGSYDFISAPFATCSPLGKIYFQFVQCRDFSFCSTIITNHMMILKLLNFVTLEPKCFARQIPLKIRKGRLTRRRTEVWPAYAKPKRG